MLFSPTQHYLGLGGRDYIGSPKQPTLTVCELSGNWYEKRLLRQSDILTSMVFPELRLDVGAVFATGQ